MEDPKKKPLIVVKEQVKLSPTGMVDKYKVDSIKAANPRDSVYIGNPRKRYSNSVPVLGEAASDYIKKAIKK